MIDDFAKGYLHDNLRWARESLLLKLEGLSEYDVRRPLTRTGTNLLGLVRHLSLSEARYLGAIFERHGQAREAFEAYRRALRFPEGFEWRHHCVACGATQPSWFDRCPSCRSWNTSRA